MRLEITRRADLAVRALAVLGADGRQMKAAELAERLGSTPGFVPQVLGPLVERGWVRSEPGPTGGYSSAVSLDDVHLLDVIEAVEGPTDTGRCVVADRPCGTATPCALHIPWQQARSQLLTALADTPASAIPLEEK